MKRVWVVAFSLCDNFIFVNHHATVADLIANILRNRLINSTLFPTVKFNADNAVFVLISVITNPFLCQFHIFLIDITS